MKQSELHPVCYARLSAPHLDHSDREHHCDGIVETGFHLKQVPNSSRHHLAAQRAEHRCGIGGCNDCPNQQRRTRRQIEGEGRASRRYPCRHDHPNGRQDRRGKPGPAYRFWSGCQSSLEQNDYQRDDRNVLGEPGIAEMDESESVIGDGHAQQQEQHQPGEPVSISDSAHRHADDDECCAEEDSGVDREAAVHPKS